MPKSHLSRFVDVITNNDGAVFAMEVGLRLALVHLLESMDPQTPQPRRMYINSSGLMVE